MVRNIVWAVDTLLRRSVHLAVMRQRLTIFLCILFLSLPALAGGLHEHALDGGHFGECHACFTAAQISDLPPAPAIPGNPPAAFLTAEELRSTYVSNGRNLFRLIPKTSPPA
jgi:hypothetical protein